MNLSCKVDTTLASFGFCLQLQGPTALLYVEGSLLALRCHQHSCIAKGKELPEAVSHNYKKKIGLSAAYTEAVKYPHLEIVQT